MKRSVRLIAIVALALVAGAALRMLFASGFGVPSAPPLADPAEVLERIGAPPSPPLSPEDALARFRIADGFRIELVAAEPLVVDPVAIAWDARGRLYVAEMRSFMPDVEGRGEDQPIGRIVVLEDEDDDGRFDRRTVFLDGLVLPRAVAVVEQGVLVAEPGTLWLCRDADEDLRCADDEKQRLLDYAFEGNVEHSENGLLPALDNWIYNAKSDRRFRFAADEGRDGEAALVVEGTAFRGQWGIDQDEYGRLLSNNNSNWLYADAFPAHYLLRHPAAPGDDAAGIAVPLGSDASVHGIRVAPGINRATTPGELREDGRLARPTAVSGLAVLRSDAFGEAMRGDVFVPEPGNQVVAHFRFRAADLGFESEHLRYPDPDWQEREFLASTDERFRPVDVEMGPDGALYVIDMYRGIIQHATYVSDYLADYIARQQLATPVGLGRIYRIVREDREVQIPQISLADAGAVELVSLLSHANGWWRSAAQRRLVQLGLEGGGDAAAGAIRNGFDAEHASPLFWVHALWSLEGFAALDEATWLRALDHPDVEVRLAALDAGAALLLDDARGLRLGRVVDLGDAPEVRIRHRALLLLGGLPPQGRPIGAMIESFAGDASNLALQQALLSGSADLEVEMLSLLLGVPALQEKSAELGRFLRDFARAAFIRSEADGDAAQLVELLALIDTQPESEQLLWRKQALLEGLWAASRRPDFERWELATRPALFRSESTDREGPLQLALRQARRSITWPDDDFIVGALPLGEDQLAMMERGAPLYEACKVCHGVNGSGQEGLAPTLVASPWVLDSDEWLARIVLGGLAGPIDVHEVRWDSVMPGHAGDPRFADDEVVAGFLTWLRRSWGNQGDPLAPEVVAAARSAVAARSTPWTAVELFAVPTQHRLERYSGKFRIDGFPLSVTVSRVDDKLEFHAGMMGGAVLDALADGSFAARDSERGEIAVRFLEGASDDIDTMMIDAGGQEVTLRRSD